MTEATKTAPPVETHRIGWLPSGDDNLHAVPEMWVDGTAWRTDGLQGVAARCGALVYVATEGDHPLGRPFEDRDEGCPRPWPTCPTCRWEVAVDSGNVRHEAGSLVPVDDQRRAIVAAGGDPDLIPRLLLAAHRRAIVECNEDGTTLAEHAAIVPLLARITAHMPVLIDDTDDPARLVCPTCSLLIETGNAPGWYEIATPAPCEALRGVAGFLGEEIDHA